LSDIQATEVSRTVITGAETETKSPKQRRYTTAYKLRIIAMADACTNPGEVASLLRKEGLYSSTLADFRRQKLRGALEPKSDKPVALRLATNEGAEGCAVVAMPNTSPEAAQKQLCDLLLGEDPLFRGALWLRMYQAGADLRTLSAADLALWDLAGKLARMPAWQMAGGCRDKVKVYVASHPDFGTPEDYAEHALACKLRGYHGYKVHGYLGWDPVRCERIPLFSRAFPEQDLDICRAIRNAVGNEFPLFHDPSGVYNLEQSLVVGHELEDLGFEWFETPMPEKPELRDAYVELCDKLTIPVCGPELLDGAHFSRADWMASGACDINRIDPHYGGLSTCLKTAALCEAHGKRLELHSTASNQYGLQLLGATSQETCCYLEEYDLDPESGVSFVGANYMVRDGISFRYPFLIGSPPIIDHRGMAPIPFQPGMGMDPDWAYIYAHRCFCKCLSVLLWPLHYYPFAFVSFAI
jgi:L-alanine-DL-glutamate epimerase-like enolase superfamily enzyme